ncbi:hypothetical protein [Thermohalobacter berrensis]|uniref:hypothetical protein n=1 Tax=Thermohalobacter berrensis TaxID=99594 RepID=UPI00160109AB|nr:hypothetical protein [Thermohalobacter berrensis]
MNTITLLIIKDSKYILYQICKYEFLGKIKKYYDIGNNDKLYVYNMHNQENGKIRWTKDKSQVKLSYYNNDKDIKILIKMLGYRPKDNPANVKIYFNDKLVDNFVKESTELEREIYVPKEVLNKNMTQVLTIKTNTWKPSDYGSKDSRDLGVQLDWIKIEEVN